MLAEELFAAFRATVGPADEGASIFPADALAGGPSAPVPAQEASVVQHV